MTRQDNLRHVRSKGRRAIFRVDYSYIFAQERLTKMTMNKRQTEYIALGKSSVSCPLKPSDSAPLC